MEKSIKVSEEVDIVKAVMVARKLAETAGIGVITRVHDVLTPSK